MPAEPTSPAGRLLAEEDGPALVLRISNPGRANALDEPILDALASLLHAPPAGRPGGPAGRRRRPPLLGRARPRRRRRRAPSSASAPASAAWGRGRRRGRGLPAPRDRRRERRRGRGRARAGDRLRLAHRAPWAPAWRCRRRGSASSTPPTASGGSSPRWARPARGGCSSRAPRSRPTRPWPPGWWTTWSSRRGCGRRRARRRSEIAAGAPLAVAGTRAVVKALSDGIPSRRRRGDRAALARARLRLRGRPGGPGRVPREAPAGVRRALSPRR